MPDLNVQLSDLRTRITFQQPTMATDAGGAQVPTWANVASVPTVWAQWVYEHGQEALQSDSLQAAQRATVTIRYRSDMVPTWRVVKDSENWKILSVDHVQDRNRWTVLIVERVKGTA